MFTVYLRLKVHIKATEFSLTKMGFWAGLYAGLHKTTSKTIVLAELRKICDEGKKDNGPEAALETQQSRPSEEIYICSLLNCVIAKGELNSGLLGKKKNIDYTSMLFRLLL